MRCQPVDDNNLLILVLNGTPSVGFLDICCSMAARKVPPETWHIDLQRKVPGAKTKRDGESW